MLLDCRLLSAAAVDAKIKDDYANIPPTNASDEFKHQVFQSQHTSIKAAGVYKSSTRKTVPHEMKLCHMLGTDSDICRL